MNDLANAAKTAIDLREKLGCPIVVISKETQDAATDLSKPIKMCAADRMEIFNAIRQSGWFFELAEEGAGSARFDPLDTERKQQAILKAAGITDDATAIAWMDSVRGAIERDRAEYEAILERHRAEISAFLERKRGGQ